MEKDKFLSEFQDSQGVKYTFVTVINLDRGLHAVYDISGRKEMIALTAEEVQDLIVPEELQKTNLFDIL